MKRSRWNSEDTGRSWIIRFLLGVQQEKNDPSLVSRNKLSTQKLENIIVEGTFRDQIHQLFISSFLPFGQAIFLSIRPKKICVFPITSKKN